MYIEINPVVLSADSAEVSTINRCDAIGIYTRDANGLAQHVADIMRSAPEFDALARVIKQSNRDARRAITVGDLRDQIGAHGPREVLFCEHCGNEYSASAGDYWNTPAGHVFKCCRRNMRLVVRRTILVDATPAARESEASCQTA